jgi:hypothetical protein
MEITEKLELNKLVRTYEGHNSFVLSLQKQLKTNKNLTRVEHNGKSLKIFSDKQYKVVKSLLNE